MEVSPLLYTMPRRITDRPHWGGHVPFAMWLIERMRPSRIVELGSETGVSLCAFAQAANKVALACEVHGVDTWEGDLHTGPYQDVKEDLVAHIRQQDYRSITLHQMFFDDALDWFADGSVDILHVDGFHTYEAVKHDVVTWIGKVRPGGVILMHDIAVQRGDFGVWRYWEEIRGSFDSLAFQHSNGLGIISVGPVVPSWFDEVSSKVDGVRHFDPAFEGLVEALGDRVVQASMVKARQREMTRFQDIGTYGSVDSKPLIKQIEELSFALDAAEKICFSRLDQLQELDERNKELQTALARAEKLCFSRLDQIQEYDMHLRLANEAIAQKDTLLAQQTRILDSHRA